jgi:hypothetical protein
MTLLQEVLGINILHTGVMGGWSGGLTKNLEVKFFWLRFQFCGSKLDIPMFCVITLYWNPRTEYD